MKPPQRFDYVPIDLKTFEDLGDGTYRLVFKTIADDGEPTRFDEEVTPEGNVDKWLEQFLIDHQHVRAKINRDVIKKNKEQKESSVQRKGKDNVKRVQKINAKFPTIR